MSEDDKSDDDPLVKVLRGIEISLDDIVMTLDSIDGRLARLIPGGRNADRDAD